MKIINKQEFYDLPENILYSNYDPCVISGLKIKKKTIYNQEKEAIDYTYIDLIGNIECDGSDDFFEILENSNKNKINFNLDFEIEERDGMFDEEEMFCIYEKKDIERFLLCLEGMNRIFE
jgi:flavodoxin